MDLMYLVIILILCFVYIWTLYHLPILVAGVIRLRHTGQNRKKKLQVSEERLPSFSIIVPVKNEEKVIGRLLKALLKLNYPIQKRKIIIVEDGSIDKTVEICKKYARQHTNQIKLLHKPTSNGKPSALNYALKYARGEIISIFDADSVPEPDVLLKAAEYFEDPSTTALQGRTCSLNADENALTKFNSYGEAAWFGIYQQGKDALNLFVSILGSCYFVRRSIINKVGGWDEKSLAEDLEISVRLAKEGYSVKYTPDVRSWQETPAKMNQLIRQWIKYSRGHMETALKYGNLMVKINRRNIDAEITLITPYMSILCLLGYFVAIYTLLVPLQPNPVFTIISQVTSLVTTATLVIVGIALIYITKPRKTTNVLWPLFIYIFWSIQAFLALYALIQIILRRPKKWAKTMKTGVVTNASKLRYIKKLNIERIAD